MTNPPIHQNTDSDELSSLSVLQKSIVQDRSIQKSVLQSATNDFFYLPDPDIKQSRKQQTAALHTSAQLLHGFHLPYPFLNPIGRSEQSSAQPTLYYGSFGSSGYAVTPGDFSVSSIPYRSFIDLQPTLQAENSVQGKDQQPVQFVSQPDTFNSGAQTSLLSFALPTHQQTAALKREPLSFQLTNGLKLTCPLPPLSLRSEPGRMSELLALSHGRISATPSSTPHIPIPSINLPTPQTMPHCSPSPADLLAVERLRLLLAIAASGSTPAPAMALPSVPSRWPSVAA